MVKANKEVIANFIGSMDMTLSIHDHLANAKRDAKLFKWDKNTYEAVKKAIRRAYLKKYISEMELN